MAAKEDDPTVAQSLTEKCVALRAVAEAASAVAAAAVAEGETTARAAAENDAHARFVEAAAAASWPLAALAPRTTPTDPRPLQMPTAVPSLTGLKRGTVAATLVAMWEDKTTEGGERYAPLKLWDLEMFLKSVDANHLDKQRNATSIVALAYLAVRCKHSENTWDCDASKCTLTLTDLRKTYTKVKGRLEVDPTLEAFGQAQAVALARGGNRPPAREDDEVAEVQPQKRPPPARPQVPALLLATQYEVARRHEFAVGRPVSVNHNGRTRKAVVVWNSDNYTSCRRTILRLVGVDANFALAPSSRAKLPRALGPGEIWVKERDVVGHVAYAEIRRLSVSPAALEEIVSNAERDANDRGFTAAKLVKAPQLAAVHRAIARASSRVVEAARNVQASAGRLLETDPGRPMGRSPTVATRRPGHPARACIALRKELVSAVAARDRVDQQLGEVDSLLSEAGRSLVTCAKARLASTRAVPGTRFHALSSAAATYEAAHASAATAYAGALVDHAAAGTEDVEGLADLEKRVEVTCREADDALRLAKVAYDALQPPAPTTSAPVAPRVEIKIHGLQIEG